MAHPLASYWQLPPLSRNLATFVFGLSLGVHTKFLPAWWFVFVPRFIWRIPPQLWRFVTAFLITGPDLGMVFDTYFFYSYLSQLESSPRFSRKEDLLWYLTFIGGAIMTINYFTGFGFITFNQALSLAMCYTVTQEEAGMKINFMFITIPAQLAPYAMLLLNLIFPGGAMNLLLQVQGLIAAHLFDFLTKIWPEYGGGRNLISTPVFMSTVVQKAREARVAVARVAGLQFLDPGPGEGAGPSNRGPLPDSWRTRGQGHRLG